MYQTVVLLCLCGLLGKIGVDGHYFDVPACRDTSWYSDENVYSSEDEEMSEIPVDIPVSTLHLHLAYKKISVLDQRSFVHLRSLKTLDLRGNDIEDINDALSTLTELQFMELSNNYITHLSNVSFRGLSSLQCLILLQNNISRLSNDTFHALIDIAAINIRSNPLRSVDGMFIKNQNLISLDLTNCQLKTFPKNLPKSLRNLVLDHNSITSIQMSHVQHLTNLQRLSLSSNELTHIASDAFYGIESLTELTLSENHLSFIPDISNFVLELYLDSNEIQSLDLEEFASRISGQQVREKQRTKISTTLDNEIEMHLRVLDLKINRIERLGNSVFSSFKNLTKLIIDNNPVTFIDKDLFKNNGNLMVLSMNKIPIKDFDAKHIFQYLRKMVTLNVKSSHQIARSTLDIKFRETIPKIKNLDLRFNNLNVFSCDQISELGTLSRVNILNNPLHCAQDDNLFCLKNQLENGPFESWNRLECDCPIDLRGVRVVDVDLNDNRTMMHCGIVTPTQVKSTASLLVIISVPQLFMVAIFNIIIAIFI